MCVLITRNNTGTISVLGQDDCIYLDLEDFRISEAMLFWIMLFTSVKLAPIAEYDLFLGLILFLPLLYHCLFISCMIDITDVPH